MAAHKKAVKPAAKKASAANTRRNASKAPAKRRWVAGVTTESTHPPEELFKKNAAVIARTLATKKVSPKGPLSGLRMLTFYINRAGKELTAYRRSELEKAKRLMRARIAKTRHLQRAA